MALARGSAAAGPFLSFLFYYSLVDGWMMGNMGDGMGAPQPTLLLDG
jgi:hypothetical protein